MDSSTQKRKSHTKSRRGCTGCKKRHVKCDEQGPPCANCVIRNTECIYPPQSKALVSRAKRQAKAAAITNAAAAAAADKSGSTTTTIVVGESNTNSSPSSNDGSGHWSAGSSNDQLLQVPGQRSFRLASSGSDASQSASPALSSALLRNSPSVSLSPSPAAYSSTRSTNRLMELELMHRWSTRTWTAIQCIAEEQPFLQTILPRIALQNNFVMDGILAMSAADLALSSSFDPATSASYLCTAIEYSNRASADFRMKVRDINKDNLYLLYYFAIIAAFFNFSVPAQRITPLARADMVFSMVLGAAKIAWVNLDWLMHSPAQLGAFMDRYKIRLEILDTLDSDTKAAIALMSAVIRTARLPPTEEFPEGQIAFDNFTYKLAVGQTKYAFAEELNRDMMTTNFLTVITVAGQDYADAIRAREPVAIYILMFWAVLVDRAAIDPTKGWWIATAGKDLVAETSEMLYNTSLTSIPEVLEGIAWTRMQVGLPPLLGCVWMDLSEPVIDLSLMDPALMGNVC